MCRLKNWEIIEESNDDNENPTVWANTIDSLEYGKYCWITFDGKNYLVEVSSLGNFITLARCKSLSSAKRWVTMNLM